MVGESRASLDSFAKSEMPAERHVLTRSQAPRTRDELGIEWNKAGCEEGCVQWQEIIATAGVRLYVFFRGWGPPLCVPEGGCHKLLSLGRRGKGQSPEDHTWGYRIYRTT